MDFLAQLSELFENIFKGTWDFDVAIIFEQLKNFFNKLAGNEEVTE